MKRQWRAIFFDRKHPHLSDWSTIGFLNGSDTTSANAEAENVKKKKKIEKARDGSDAHYKRNQRRKLIKLHPAAGTVYRERYTEVPLLTPFVHPRPHLFGLARCLPRYATHTPPTHSVSPSLGNIEKKL